MINEEGKKIGTIHQIQESGKAIEEATAGMQVAVSVKEATIGRQINEGDIFYTDLHSRQAKQLLGRFNHRLNDSEKEVLNMLVAKKRKSEVPCLRISLGTRITGNFEAGLPDPFLPLHRLPCLQSCRS